MSWYPTLVFYFGLFDAGIIMAGGLLVAVYILLGWDYGKMFERIGPALAVVIGSNVAAALILGATRWLIG
ncbi:hypothetical protein [Bradyrhizobium valentinum]|uniref:Uncharacterized protein n=1 Tax=Bradyrhizobium valentinum TaxID=1518501 RepID=A0A0R3KU71_9BRAD|nr:hypothetical protein [Bradyrhizobium valentinum]KRQ99240.1 hypothetical protein CP49_11620 [Bradyrhizobium valentinum]